jgi:vacuolar iron transporter family protein
VNRTGDPRSPPVRAQRDHHDRVDPHVQGRWLSDLILGAQDGLVNTLGIVLGVAAASADGRLVLAAGLAAGAAEAISMGAVAYTSSVARGDLFQAERAREYRHLEVAPEIERDEVRQLYAAKGFAGEGLDRVVETICANKDVWVAVMMAEEHGLAEIDRRASLRSAALVGSSSLLGAAIPVIPFAVLARGLATAAALVVGAIGLFALGAFKAKVTATSRTRGGATLLAIGLASAVAGYLVGAALGVAPP